MNRAFAGGRRVRCFLLVLGVLLGTMVLITPVLAQDDVETNGLRPGQTVTYRQIIPVNIVFIGYSKPDINERAMRSILPSSAQPIVRYPAFYGAAGRETGLAYDYRYSVTFASKKFTQGYFAYA